MSTESEDPPPQGTHPDWSKARSVTVTANGRQILSGGEGRRGRVEEGADKEKWGRPGRRKGRIHKRK